MQWRDDTTLPSRGLGLRPIGKSSECFRMTAGVRTGKAQNEHMFYRFAPESGPQRLITACRMSAADITLRNKRSTGSDCVECTVRLFLLRLRASRRLEC